ncbi:MAG: pyruvate ferredoxin oxidoreductase [Anaerolineae bacterium]|nr:pyruvate ferredoxin oxidoreductase [Anaerolineae bacterium]
MAIEFISGCKAAAEAARLANVDVVAAYPITPQTSIVEYLAKDVSNGRLKAEMVLAESEHSAMSACVGASMVGARAFTATASQGLALMHEVLFYAAGLRLPIVSVIVNRSLASPVSIFADFKDSLAQRDTGWLQFYVESCQEILDSVLIAYRVIEDSRVLLPAFVCMEGFVLSHLSEPVDVPDVQTVSKFLPACDPKYPTLDLKDPKIFNVMAFPDTYEEFERDKQISMLNAFEALQEAYQDFEKIFGRKYQDVETYRVEDADIVLATMGAAAGTAMMVVDQLRSLGERVGLVKVRTFRPFPRRQLREILSHARVVGVLDRDLSIGSTGILFQELQSSLYNQPQRPLMQNFIAGLGGRDIHQGTIGAIFQSLKDTLQKGFVEKNLNWPDENREVLSIWGLPVDHDD